MRVTSNAKTENSQDFQHKRLFVGQGVSFLNASVGGGYERDVGFGARILIPIVMSAITIAFLEIPKAFISVMKVRHEVGRFVEA